MKKIDAEAHFYTVPYHDYIISRQEIPREEMHKGYLRLWYSDRVWEPHGSIVEDKLLEFSDRLKIMDENEIDMQVLSLSTPGCEQFNAADGTMWAQKTNDSLAEVIAKNSKRFAGLAALAPQDPDKAARELERSVKQLGLKGAKLNCHVGNRYLDNKEFWPVFEVAEKLDVPVYLHPNTPSPAMIGAFEDYGFALAGPALGFTMEAAVSGMRLMYSGLFDRYPGLKMIMGHMGEGLVHWIYRIDFAYKKAWMDEEVRPKIKQSPSHYLKNNFYITTSGMNSLPAFNNAYAELGADRIMFSADYPYEKSDESAAFIEKIPVNDAGKNKILHGNAEELFKL
jgi:5-carboxyvanillate decarboxylase